MQRIIYSPETGDWNVPIVFDFLCFALSFCLALSAMAELPHARNAADAGWEAKLFSPCAKDSGRQA
jgi:hypothetical protein